MAKQTAKNLDKTRSQSDVLLEQIEEHLVWAGRGLQSLAKLDPEGFAGWRRKFSSLAVLALGRMGKLNLNASVSEQAREAWFRNDGSEI